MNAKKWVFHTCNFINISLRTYAKHGRQKRDWTDRLLKNLKCSDLIILQKFQYICPISDLEKWLWPNFHPETAIHLRDIYFESLYLLHTCQLEKWTPLGHFGQKIVISVIVCWEAWNFYQLNHRYLGILCENLNNFNQVSSERMASKVYTCYVLFWS